MSYWVAGAAIGSAIIGAYSANKSSEAASDAAEAGIESTKGIMGQARNDSINLFSRGLQSSQSGITGALQFYQNNAQAKTVPFVQGNVAAQRVLGQGATQANNAILGRPVDMSFANNPRILPSNYSGITSAAVPTLGAGASYADTLGVKPAGAGTDTDAAVEDIDNPTKQEILEMAGGKLRSVRDADFYNPIKRIGNPVGLSDSMKDKVDKYDPVGKFLGGIF